jgi:hypothetical protein
VSFGGSASGNPFVMWASLGWKTGAMMMEAAQVIGHRTGRMALSPPAPGATDRREFALMKQEKVEAAVESAQAIGLRLAMLNQLFVELALRQMLTTTIGMMALACSRTPTRSSAHQSRLVHDALAGSTVLGCKLVSSTAQIGTVALSPLHTRVRANALRLAKR